MRVAEIDSLEIEGSMPADAIPTERQVWMAENGTNLSLLPAEHPLVCGLRYGMASRTS